MKGLNQHVVVQCFPENACNYCNNWQPWDGLCKEDNEYHHPDESCNGFKMMDELVKCDCQESWYLIKLQSIRTCEDCPIRSRCLMAHPFNDRENISACPLIKVDKVSVEKRDIDKLITLTTDEEWKI